MKDALITGLLIAGCYGLMIAIVWFAVGRLFTG